MGGAEGPEAGPGGTTDLPVERCCGGEAEESGELRPEETTGAGAGLGGPFRHGGRGPERFGGPEAGLQVRSG